MNHDASTNSVDAFVFMEREPGSLTGFAEAARMAELLIMYRDVDRTPYLFVLRHCAHQLGLDLEFVRSTMPSTGATGEEWGELLAHGEVDVLAESYWGLQNYRRRGIPFVTVAANVDRWTDKLLVGAGIASIEDLHGKRMAVRPVGPSTLLTALWLKDNGLTDVQQVVVPEAGTGRWGHWKAVASGECEGCFVSPLYMEPALRAGLQEIAFEHYPCAGGKVAMTTTERVAATKGPSVQKLVDAMCMTSDAFRADPSLVVRVIRDEAAELLAEHFVGEPGLPDRLHALLRDELSPLPVPTAAGVHNAHRIRLAVDPEFRDFNPMLMWDLSFARASMARYPHR